MKTYQIFYRKRSQSGDDPGWSFYQCQVYDDNGLRKELSYLRDKCDAIVEAMVIYNLADRINPLNHL